MQSDAETTHGSLCVCVCESVAVDGFFNVFTYVACGLIESNKIHANARVR